MTREQAIAALVEHDVARWGEGERAASARAHSARSIGRALNELANRAEHPALHGDTPMPAGLPAPAELRRMARAALTAADHAALRRGG